MAENVGGLDDIFHLLFGFPQERLLGLRRKLEQSTPTNSRKLLEAIILQSLGQTVPALEVLRGLPDSKAAQYITSKIQTERGQCRGPPVSPPRDPDSLQTVAQLCTLLEKENMWGVFAGDNAYKDVSRANDADQPHTLRSRTDPFTSLTSPRAVSPSIPINRGNQHAASTVPGSLHSSISLASLTSNLAISESPTALFLSASGRHAHQPRTPSKLCEGTSTCSVKPGGGGDAQMLGDMDDDVEFVNQPVECEDKTGYPATGPAPQTLLPPPASEHFPVECTDIADTRQLVTAASDTEKDKAQKPDETSAVSPTGDLLPGNSCLTRLPVEATSPPNVMEGREPISSSPNLPVEDSRPPTETESKEPSSSSHFSPPATEQDSTESGFFSFVILHVKEDEETACRVRDALESLEIAGGTTYCDEFARPGSSPLKCIQDAIDNSAFTILLLTKRWKSRWASFQTNNALMNAIQRKHKYNTVIPFLPRSDPLEDSNMPLALTSLTALDERSSRFTRVVKNTFRPEAIRRQKDIWRKEEEIRMLEKRTEDLEEEANLSRQRQEACMKLMAAQQMFQFFQPMPSMWPSTPAGFTGPSAGMPPFFPGMAQFPQMPWTPGTPPGSQFPCYPPFCTPINNMPPQFYPAGAYGPTQTVYQPHPGISQGTQYASGGQHPVIQIQHASNVQIGDQNQMRIDGAGEEAVSTEQEKDESV